MTFERIEQLVRERFNGNHRGCRLHMSGELSKRLMQRYQPPEAEREIERLRNSVFGAPLLYHLMDIPIINDIGITDELQWILVDSTGEEVERGEVEAVNPFQWSYGPIPGYPEPAMKWHTGCGGEVMAFDGVHCCHKCGMHDEEEARNADAAKVEASGTQSE